MFQPVLSCRLYFFYSFANLNGLLVGYLAPILVVHCQSIWAFVQTIENAMIIRTHGQTNEQQHQQKQQQGLYWNFGTVPTFGHIIQFSLYHMYACVLCMRVHE